MSTPTSDAGVPRPRSPAAAALDAAKRVAKAATSGAVKRAAATTGTLATTARRLSQTGPRLKEREESRRELKSTPGGEEAFLNKYDRRLRDGEAEEPQLGFYP